MKYNDYKHTIKSGDLLVWSTVGVRSFIDFLCQIVRIGTKSEYDHVGVAIWQDGELYVLEAVPPRVRTLVLSRKLPFYHIPMSVDWTEESEKYALSKCGEKYSIWQAFISYFTKPSADSEWQCVELARDIYKNLGLEFDCGYTPAKFVTEVLKKTGNCMRMIVG